MELIISLRLDDREIKNRIVGWEGCIVHGHYSYPSGERAWDMICPTKLFNRVAALVGLPKKKKNMNMAKLLGMSSFVQMAKYLFYVLSQEHFC